MIEEGCKVKINEPGHEYEGLRGVVLYIPDEDGPWYEIKMPDGITAVVYNRADLEIVS